MGGNANVDVELTALQTFRSRVDDLLAELDASAAAPGQIATHAALGNCLGNSLYGFGEVAPLSATYESVHQQLQQLSQTLNDQINAMSITAQVSQLGYQNVESAQVDALWTIQSRTEAATPPPGQSGLTVQQQLDAKKRQEQQTAPKGGTGKNLAN